MKILIGKFAFLTLAALTVGVTAGSAQTATQLEEFAVVRGRVVIIATTSWLRDILRRAGSQRNKSSPLLVREV